MSVRILIGDCRDLLRTLPDESVHCVVTSPPYWGLRDYGTGSSGIGLEQTVDEHMDALVGVFREVRRILRADGTLWLNYGDAYAGSWGAQGRGDKRAEMDARDSLSAQQIAAHPKRRQTGSLIRTGGCKAKDLMGLPWMLAFALRADGWYLRQEIIWHKPNPMPESVRDRCTKAHEHLFILSKSDRYWFDSEAIAEPAAASTVERVSQPNNDNQAGSERAHAGGKTNGNMKAVVKKPRMPKDQGRVDQELRPAERFGGGAGWRDNPDARPITRNKRSVWTVNTEGYSEAHFATFPPSLIEPCIKAGCPEGGTVLDPFGGAGTTGLVADRLKRNAILLELNPDYAAMAQRRIANEAGIFGDVKIETPTMAEAAE